MRKSSRVIDVYQESLLAKFKKLDKLKQIFTFIEVATGGVL